MPLSEFQRALQLSASVGVYDPLMELLKNLSPASIDSEIRGLSPDNGGDGWAIPT
jgi:hypothetical protein